MAWLYFLKKALSQNNMSGEKKHKARELKSDIIDEFLKTTNIKTKLQVSFEMEYLTIIIKPDRQATDAEIKEAHEWGKKMAARVMEDYKDWEYNGRPD